MFKKFASADGIAGRKPYGFCTRMIHCVGWKRLEANRMFCFDDVDKRNFNAILRRSLVWRVKARFEDPHVLQGAYSDISKDGVFPKDPDLQAFLTSGPAVAACLQIQHAFEMKFNKDDCINIIENYVSFGGDGGLTEDTMRAACKLPARDRREARSLAAAVINVETDQDEQDDVAKQWKTAHRALVDFMLIRKKVFATQTFLGSMKVRDGPNLSKEGMVQGLLNMNFMMQCKGGGKTDIQFLPILSGQVSVQDAISHRTRTCDLKLEEVYDVGKFAEYMHKHRFRKENAEVLAEVWKNCAVERLRPGRPTPQELKQKEDLQKKAEELLHAEKLGDRLLDQLEEDATTKRKLEQGGGQDVKDEEASRASSSAKTKVQRTRYHYPEGFDNLRSRKQVDGLGAQKFSRRVQMALVGGTHDLDIENCMFTLLPQLLEKLQVDPEMPEEARGALLRCRDERAVVCQDIY